MNENANENTAKSKKYFWYRLMDSFFDRTDIKLILKLQGTDYVVLYQKMMCRCLRNDGYLSMNGLPLDNKSLSVILDEDEEKVNKAIEVFKSYNLLEKENDFYYLPEFETLTGSESEYAEKKRDYRAKNKANGQSQDNSKTMSDTKSDIVRDRDIERDKDISEIETETNNNDDVPPQHNDVDALISEYNISNAVADAVKRWIDYKKKSGKPLNEVSLQSLFERVEEYEQRYKASDIIEIIRTSISAQYKDIVFVRLDEKREREKGFDRFAVWGDTECINDDEILNDTQPEEVKEPIRAPQKQFNTDNAIDHYDFSDEVSKSYKRWVKQKGNFDKKETDIFAHCTMLFGSDIAVKVLERCISEELKEVDFERLFNEVFAYE